MVMVGDGDGDGDGGDGGVLVVMVILHLFTQCCACHEICTSRFTSRSQGDSQQERFQRQHQDAKKQLSLETSSDF